MGAAFSIISVLFAFKGDDFCPLTRMEFISPIVNLLQLQINGQPLCSIRPIPRNNKLGNNALSKNCSRFNI